jgi:L-iditol 2-dehydrogenase
MKSMVLTSIREMRMIEVDKPGILNPTDVLIRMKTVGVCGSDIHYYTLGKIGSQVVSYPFAVGHEGAGQVEKVGPGVTLVKVGDKVAIEPAMPCFECDQCLSGRHHTCRKLLFLGCPGQADGCLSEYIVMPETSCFPLAENMTYDDGAISEPLSIGVYAVRLANMEIQHLKVGILGFGPIGMSVLLAAKARGASCFYVTDKLDYRCNMAVKSGAVWAGNPDQSDIVTQIKKNEPGLLDVIFECCGKQEATDQAIELLKPGGKLMMIGIPEFDRWSFPVDQLRRKEICIQNVRRQNHAVEETLSLLEKKMVDISLMPTHRFPFEKTKEAFDLVAGYRDGVMKAMIDFE